jgi:hypothetical protein
MVSITAYTKTLQLQTQCIHFHYVAMLPHKYWFYCIQNCLYTRNGKQLSLSREVGPVLILQLPIMISVLKAWLITEHFHTVHFLLFEVALLETIIYEMKQSDIFYVFVRKMRLSFIQS